MEFGLTDTDPEAGRVHLALLRRATPERRLRLAFSLSRTAMGLSRAALAKRHAGASREELGLRFVALVYGTQLSEDVRAYLASRES